MSRVCESIVNKRESIVNWLLKIFKLTFKKMFQEFAFVLYQNTWSIFNKV